MRTAKLEVRRYKGAPETPWMIDLRIDGKRVRKFFATQKLAEAELARIKVKRRNEGENALKLTDPQRVEAYEAFQKLKPFGRSLTEAVSFFVNHVEQTQKSITVRALAEEYLEKQKSRNRSIRHQRDLRIRYDRFNLAFGDRMACDVQSKEIEKWLFSLKVGPVSFNNYRERIGFLFGYGIKHGYLAKNPIDSDRLEKMPVIEQEIPIFKVDELKAILDRATPEMIPFLVIGAFSGLRTAELFRLDWADVNLTSGYVEVKAAKAKSARRRSIKMEKNLLAWLQPYAGRTGRIWNGSEHLYNLLRPISVAAGLSKWPTNGLRHSFASYHLAANQNQNQLADILGHTNSRLIFSNYRELVMPDQAARYFNIMPPAAATNVVSIAA
jgi:integrase